MLATAPPVSFSDTELTLLLRVAAAIPIEHRAQLLCAVARAGAGSIRRIATAHLTRAMLATPCPEGDCNERWQGN
jgi:hypothetical protein